MTNEEKARELAGYDIGTSRSLMSMEARDEYDSLIKMAKWKDENPSDELIKKICKLCDKFDKDAPWQSACWCEHAEEDDWDAVYWRRLQFIKKHLKDKK